MITDKRRALHFVPSDLLKKVFLAAHQENKMKREDYINFDIDKCIAEVVNSQSVNLRVLGSAVVGCVRIYSKQYDYFIEDCSKALETLESDVTNNVLSVVPTERSSNQKISSRRGAPQQLVDDSLFDLSANFKPANQRHGKMAKTSKTILPGTLEGSIVGSSSHHTGNTVAGSSLDVLFGYEFEDEFAGMGDFDAQWKHIAPEGEEETEDNEETAALDKENNQISNNKGNSKLAEAAADIVQRDAELDQLIDSEDQEMNNMPPEFDEESPIINQSEGVRPLSRQREVHQVTAASTNPSSKNPNINLNSNDFDDFLNEDFLHLSPSATAGQKRSSDAVTARAAAAANAMLPRNKQLAFDEVIITGSDGNQKKETFKGLIFVRSVRELDSSLINQKLGLVSRCDWNQKFESLFPSYSSTSTSAHSSQPVVASTLLDFGFLQGGDLFDSNEGILDASHNNIDSFALKESVNAVRILHGFSTVNAGPADDFVNMFTIGEELIRSKCVTRHQQSMMMQHQAQEALNEAENQVSNSNHDKNDVNVDASTNMDVEMHQHAPVGIFDTFEQNANAAWNVLEMVSENSANVLYHHDDNDEDHIQGRQFNGSHSNLEMNRDPGEGCGANFDTDEGNEDEQLMDKNLSSRQDIDRFYTVEGKLFKANVVKVLAEIDEGETLDVSYDGASQGWSRRTVKLLQALMQTREKDNKLVRRRSIASTSNHLGAGIDCPGSKIMSMHAILENCDASIAAICFFELLVLKTRGVLDLKQYGPYGDILIDIKVDESNQEKVQAVLDAAVKYSATNA